MNSYIAIDVSKHELVTQADCFKQSLPYDPSGLKKLLKRVQELSAPLVAFEATGGYERKLINLLAQEQIPYARINPQRVRAFARSDGLKAKTDSIDADLILRFAQQKKLTADIPLAPKSRELQEWMDRRSQLTEMLSREKNRREKEPQYSGKSIEKMIRLLQKEIESINQKIKQIIAGDAELKELDRRMQSVCGIGETTSWAVLAYLGEIRHLSRNQLVALAGLAPFNQESGRITKKRRIEGGRAKLRKCLYMAAQTAAIHNPYIKAYAERLKDRGKPYKWIMVAIMRKLLIHLRSLVQNPQIMLAS